ncbi:Bug family tripartite tricarboxylate transporter substrate binding protein [Parapusillimonas granuli]|uniref:Tripartite tricarboxylate transporter substrate binding protein n=1 Tax=Parapusillimonas granuli TaxID=380911 RepID=A0A853FUR7_9BURK|nr:tripartite tricarboxylate transporter substrate binding protein [Parapusillimonas granuli]MBB5215628.1 tripartite-type tricarboxylate transporter receptor subunit TctC [Parapusillimonas granuli]MEB2400994.1 tripartite tricarboxylate transporter substrate binding protein [Alcaligenaceae bacterium]NYT49705.1 tripartite tricarboxylate transporter substrate binding protein [Parapusillimonas granuli]
MKLGLKFIASLIALSAALLSGTSTAQGWPERSIRVIVPFAPGGGTDIFTRVMAPRLSEVLGQQIVVDNKPGGSSIIGSQQVAQAAPDGYTLLIVDSTFMINPSLRNNLPYDSVKDFTPIVHLASGPVILVANPKVPAQSLKELIDLAKKEPGRLFYGSGGNGASTHLAGELFNMVAGVKIEHVPFKGTGEALTAVMSGQVPLTFTGISSARGPVEDGRLRAFAVTGERRSEAMPNVPTFDEAGLANVNSSTQWGVYGPRNLPADIVAKLNHAFNEALKDPAVKERVVGLGYALQGGTPAEFEALTKSEIEKWRNLITAAKISIN